VMRAWRTAKLLRQVFTGGRRTTPPADASVDVPVTLPLERQLTATTAPR
jgi:hypothetical protein